jgi:putative resolvase
MFRNGKLPFGNVQLPTGTIIVYPDEKTAEQKTVLYARVSSHDRREDLLRQMERLRNFAAERGFVVSGEITEIGSGPDGERRKLNKILSDRTIGIIVVEHRDRLARFGVPMLEAALSAEGRKIVVINDSEYGDDMIQDFTDLIISMCAKIYGRRSARNKARKALEALEDE